MDCVPLWSFQIHVAVKWLLKIHIELTLVLGVQSLWKVKQVLWVLYNSYTQEWWSIADANHTCHCHFCLLTIWRLIVRWGDYFWWGGGSLCVTVHIALGSSLVALIHAPSLPDQTHSSLDLFLCSDPSIPCNGIRTMRHWEHMLLAMDTAQRTLKLRRITSTWPRTF